MLILIILQKNIYIFVCVCIYYIYLFIYIYSGSTMAQNKANGCDMMQSMATTILSETTSGAGNNGLQDKGTLFTHEHANVIIHSA